MNKTDEKYFLSGAVGLDSDKIRKRLGEFKVVKGYT